MSDDPVVDPLATTPLGLPYPVSTDPVAQGAAAIQALAQAVDAHLTPPLLLRGSDLTNPLSLGFINTVNGKRVNMYHGDNGAFTFEFYGILGDILRIDSSGGVYAMGQRVHRHPYAGDRHAEAGFALVNPGAAVTVSFTLPYTSIQSIVSTSAGGGQYGYADTISNTAFRLWNSHPSAALYVYWMSDGYG